MLLKHKSYLYNVLVYSLWVSVHQVDLLGELVLDDDPLLQLGLFLCHGCSAAGLAPDGRRAGNWGSAGGGPGGGQGVEALAPPAAHCSCPAALPPWQRSKLKLMSCFLRPL